MTYLPITLECRCHTHAQIQAPLHNYTQVHTRTHTHTHTPIHPYTYTHTPIYTHTYTHAPGYGGIAPTSNTNNRPLNSLIRIILSYDPAL